MEAQKHQVRVVQEHPVKEMLAVLLPAVRVMLLLAAAVVQVVLVLMVCLV
jgi:hypothetical protein